MSALAIAFAASFLVSLMLTPAIRDFALRRELVDAVNSSRKVHSGRVPRLGGVAMLCAFFASVPLALLLEPSLRTHLPELSVVAGGAAVLGLLGLVDDLRGVRARSKLVVQCLVAAAVVASGIRIQAISLPALGNVRLGALALPITISWIVGVVNAVNLIDGLDGLAGGTSLLTLGSGVALAVGSANLAFAVLLAAAAGGVLGFLRYNFHPASIFMGDAGSMFLGYLLAISAIVLPGDASPATPVGISLALLAVPLTDTTVAIARRVLRGRSIFSADREHIHHLLLDAGISHRTVVLVLCGVSATFCFAALAAGLVGGGLAPAIALAVSVAAALELWRRGLLHRWAGVRRQDQLAEPSDPLLDGAADRNVAVPGRSG